MQIKNGLLHGGHDQPFLRTVQPVDVGMGNQCHRVAFDVAFQLAMDVEVMLVGVAVIPERSVVEHNAVVPRALGRLHVTEFRPQMEAAKPT